MNIISAAFIKGINLHTNIQKKMHNHYRVSGGFESPGIEYQRRRCVFRG